MRASRFLVFAGAILFFACGGSPSPKGSGTGGSGSGGGGQGGPIQHTLAIHLSGSGQIQSASPAFSCSADCQQTIDAAVTVQLSPAPDAGWAFTGWQGACSGAGDCIVPMSADAQVTARFAALAPPGTLVTVALTGTGTGKVTSNPAGVACPGACSILVAPGASVSLTPQPEATSLFIGWGGACSGSGPCVLTTASKPTVWVNFGLKPPPPPPTVKRTLVVAIAGSGTVTSTPAGISCPGTCSASFDDGTEVALAGTPAAGSKFTSWSGACTGNAGCTFKLTADASMGATFDRLPPADCAGVVPPSLGASVTRTIQSTPSSRNFCSGATSDQLGDVAGHLGGMGPGNWSLWAADGSGATTLSQGVQELIPQAEGYQGIWSSPTIAGHTFLTDWTPDGTTSQSTALGPWPNAVYTTEAVFGATSGGSVVIRQSCYVPAGSGSATNDLIVWRFDGAGSQVSKVNLGGPGCPAQAAALSDELDRTLVVIATGGTGAFNLPANQMIARWLDRAGSPLTDWFEIAPLGANGPGWAPSLQPLIGGGAVLSSEQVWIASFPSGGAGVDKVPAFLTDQHNLRIVRGGKAYAVVPGPSASDSGTLDFYSPAGNHCGSLKVMDNAQLYVGADGTVLSLSGPSGCDLTWWSKLLQ